jgi:hypothetical protein
MRFFFKLASAAYISGIFLLAGSPVVERLGQFNPYSLLHIPLYGILTLLLIFSFIPMTQLRSNSVAHRLTQRHNNQMTQLPNNLKSRFLVVGLIALIVAIADEIYQSLIPFRDASVTDVFLDLIAISFVLIVLSKYYKKSQKAWGL